MSARQTFLMFDATKDVRKMLLTLITDSEEKADQRSRKIEFNMSDVTFDFTSRTVTIDGIITAYGLGPDTITLNEFVAALKTEPMYPDGWVTAQKK